MSHYRCDIYSVGRCEDLLQRLSALPYYIAICSGDRCGDLCSGTPCTLTQAFAVEAFDQGVASLCLIIPVTFTQ